MLNKSFEIIEELRNLIKKSFFIPVLEKAVIDREKILSLIEELDNKLPEDIIEAQKILKRKDEILKEAQDEAQTILRIAREKENYLLNENTITQKAQREAELIIQEAKKEAEYIKKEAEGYALLLLNKVEETLKKELEIIEKCKNGL